MRVGPCVAPSSFETLYQVGKCRLDKAPQDEGYAGSAGSMTINAEAPKGVTIATPLPLPVRRRIFVYLGILIVLVSFGAPYGGLIDIPVSFFLKNRLHL